MNDITALLITLRDAFMLAKHVLIGKLRRRMPIKLYSFHKIYLPLHVRGRIMFYVSQIIYSIVTIIIFTLPFIYRDESRGLQLFILIGVKLLLYIWVY